MTHSSPPKSAGSASAEATSSFPDLSGWQQAALDLATALATLEAHEADLGEPMHIMEELGRIPESRGLPSFRIRVGHIRQWADALQHTAASDAGPPASEASHIPSPDHVWRDLVERANHLAMSVFRMDTRADRERARHNAAVLANDIDHARQNESNRAALSSHHGEK